MNLETSFSFNLMYSHVYLDHAKVVWLGYSKQETVEVTLKVPKRIVDFLKDYEKGFDMTLEKYCLHAVIQMVGADIDAIDLALGPVKVIVGNYGLETVLKEYNALPYMAKEC